MICNDCGAVFDANEIEVKTWEEYRGECWGAPAYERMASYHCPKCGSEDIEEAEDEE